MKSSPHRIKHAKRKAIRSVKKGEYEKEAKKMKAKEVKKYTTSPKKAKINRGKVRTGHKHRKTSPKEVTWETEPDSIHREGTNWIHTIQKQTLAIASRLQNKLQKFKLFRRRK